MRALVFRLIDWIFHDFHSFTLIDECLHTYIMLIIRIFLFGSLLLQNNRFMRTY